MSTLTISSPELIHTIKYQFALTTALMLIDSHSDDIHEIVIKSIEINKLNNKNKKQSIHKRLGKYISKQISSIKDTLKS